MLLWQLSLAIFQPYEPYDFINFILMPILLIKSGKQIDSSIYFPGTMNAVIYPNFLKNKIF
jgi:hypothetical protein